jgi:hypothetical protein
MVACGLCENGKKLRKAATAREEALDTSSRKKR